MEPDYEKLCAKQLCESDHLFFVRYFFKHRKGAKFRVNWHHHLMAAAVDDVLSGATENLVINVPPGSSKTEFISINLMARGFALNPRSRFMHLSYSDSLALQNSQTARDIVRSPEYQEFWPVEISDDTNSKKQWNTKINGMDAGGVYATALGGQVTGFRAGQMEDGFHGCLLLDDPLKPEDAFSRLKIATANRRLLSTVDSRRATPTTPVIIIMQRIAERDPSGFVLGGGLPGNWKHLRIPAILDRDYIDALEPRYQRMIAAEQVPVDGEKRRSYWEFKEPLARLEVMEAGAGTDDDGAAMGRHVFSAQYQQQPKKLGGNLIRGEWFRRHTVLPKIVWRKIFADTAQKTKERNDYSVFECYGLGSDGILYLLDLIRGKWEAPELQARATAFWKKHAAMDVDKLGQLREMMVEDKSSGTGLVQTIRSLNAIPIKGIERNKDKLTRCMDAQPYLEQRLVSIPEDAPWASDFVSECESFTSDDSHDFDDQVDPLFDAVENMLSSGNKLKTWENLA